MTSAPELDMAKTEAFGGKMLGFLNGWAGAMCLSVGHRTGLLDAMAGLAPSTSQQIADAVGFDERYVREWLHAMVVSGVISTTAKRRRTRCRPSMRRRSRGRRGRTTRRR